MLASWACWTLLATYAGREACDIFDSSRHSESKLHRLASDGTCYVQLNCQIRVTYFSLRFRQSHRVMAVHKHG
jgi:hypothetical protein